MWMRVKEKWGSRVAGYRQAIREDIFARCAEGAGPEALKEILNLKKPPLLKEGYVSISHSLGLGGYVWSENPIGFDLEFDGRVAERTALRVSSEEQLNAAPSATALWCAKEAIFKALRHSEQPKTIDKIVTYWLDEGTFTIGSVEGDERRQGRGLISKQGDYLIAVFENEVVL